MCVYEDGSCKGCGWIINVDNNSFHISAKEKSKKPCHKCLKKMVEYSNKVWDKTIENDSYIVLDEEE